MQYLMCVPLLLGVVVMAGCEAPESATWGEPQQTAATAPAPQNLFRSEQYQVELAYPERGVRRVGHTTGYFDNQGWRVDAGPDQPGQRLLVLQLAGSDDVTTGQLRLGVSRDPGQVRDCTQPGNTAADRRDDPVFLGGVPFVAFQEGDAGMSHYQNVHAYRTVRGGTCYAIDLVVQGTNPQVYDPPRTPPFSQQQGFDRLRRLLSGFSFSDALSGAPGDRAAPGTRPRTTPAETATSAR